MNIGIVIYSQTGNTLSVAERLRDRLTEEGHTSAIERVTVEGEVKPGTPVQLTACPDPAGYDAVVFASPVQGFSLALAMKAYLEQVGGLSGKPVALYITQHLKPFFRREQGDPPDVCGVYRQRRPRLRDRDGELEGCGPRRPDPVASRHSRRIPRKSVTEPA